MHEPASYKSPLHQMTQTTPTFLWNDSASIQELTYSIEHGAVGATCNPVIVLEVLMKEMHLWKDRIYQLIRDMPTATEEQISWKLVEEISAKGAELLKPIFNRHNGKKGRLSIQNDPHLYRDSMAIVSQAVRFSQLAPNTIVKIPVTRAGIPAIEEATYRGGEHQCYDLLHTAAMYCRRGGAGTRAAKTGERGPRHFQHGAGVRIYGREAG